VTIVESLRGTPYPFQQKKQLFRNEGTGKPFQEVSAMAGPAFGLAEVSRGAVFGDIDNDGDIDILVTNNNGPVRLLLNEAASRNRWLQVRLEGVKDNRHGLGARVAVLRKNQAPLWRRAHTDGSYLSASDSRVHFGLGQNTDLEGVVVRWTGGSQEIWTQIKPNAIVTLRQQTGKPYKGSEQ
jgi:hypothetical protein